MFLADPAVKMNFLLRKMLDRVKSNEYGERYICTIRYFFLEVADQKVMGQLIE